tara:strand:- start:148 stop:249 length:102 start_codon:yes stop_codon:yes gene_type:complete
VAETTHQKEAHTQEDLEVVEVEHLILQNKALTA